MRSRAGQLWIILGILLGLVAAGLWFSRVLKNNAQRPRLLARDVMSAAGLVAGKVAPGEIVLLYPSLAGPEKLAEYQLASDGRVSTSIGDTRVLFDGIAAPLYYAVNGKIATIVPYEVANSTRTRVTVEYKGRRSPEITLPVAPSVPAIFTSDPSGRGQAGMLNEVGCCNSAQNPAARGSVVTLYATGEGETVPKGIDGNVTPYTRVADLPVPRQKLNVTVGGQPAEILFAGDAPLAVAGLLQVNFRVPPNAPLGDAVPLVLTVGATSSPDGVTMAIKSPVRRILAIAAEPAIRNRIQTVFTGSDYELLVARDGSEAEALVHEASPDLVIYDLAMPETTVRTLQALRTKNPKLRIIAIAKTLDPATLRYADLLDAQAVFRTSLDAETLLGRARQILSEHALPYATEGQVLPPMPRP